MPADTQRSVQRDPLKYVFHQTDQNDLPDNENHVILHPHSNEIVES
jgi:hypothetical protein